MSEIPIPEETNNSRLIIGSKAMRAAYDTMKHYSRYADTILLVGETGVGKDLVAHEIHRLSNRRDKPFERVSLSALSDTLLESELFGHVKGAFTGADKDKTGIIEASDGGTLYFSEISDIPQSIQLKLLDFIQYRTFKKVGEDHKERIKKVDVCLIFATNDEPEVCVKNKKLRKDFYYRISECQVALPPLRDRVDEIGTLSLHFAGIYGNMFFNKEISVSEGAIEELKCFHWFGNVRELENTIKKLLIQFADYFEKDTSEEVISKRHVTNLLHYENNSIKRSKHNIVPFRSLWLFSDNTNIPSYNRAKNEMKKLYFTKLLEHTGGDLVKASAVSGLTERGLRKIFTEIEINNELEMRNKCSIKE